GADPIEDVVDREGSEGVLELLRTPPPVSLQWMVTEVDETTVVIVAVERCLVDPAVQSGDATGERGLGIRTRDQVGLGPVAPPLCDQRLDGGHRDDEIAEA